MQAHKEHEMTKRRERYNPVTMVKRDRALTAELKVKDLRGEVHDLKKQLFRALESARIANEEADMRAQAQKQIGDALRERVEAMKTANLDLYTARDNWRIAALKWKHEVEALRDASVWRIAAQRIAARFAPDGSEA